MPVSFSTRQKRESAPDFASSMGLSHIDTTSILFGDEDESHKEAATSPDVKSYLQANTTEDKFPILVRSNHKPGTVSHALSDILNFMLIVCPSFPLLRQP